MNMKNLFISTFLFISLGFIFVSSTSKKVEQKLDVLSYEARIQPDISTNRIDGQVRITFSVTSGTKEVRFNCGSLKISTVTGENIKGHEQQGSQLVVFLKDQSKVENFIFVVYKSYPTKGVVFQSYPE